MILQRSFFWVLYAFLVWLLLRTTKVVLITLEGLTRVRGLGMLRRYVGVDDEM